MKILITGAAGFVGTNLTAHFARQQREVIAIDSLSRIGSEQNAEWLVGEFPGVRFLRHEIEDLPSVILKEQPEIVFHFAAQVAVTSSLANPIRDFRINAEGSFLVAKSAQDLGIPVVYTSTNKVYGDNVNRIPIKEAETRYDFDGEFCEKGLPETFSIDADHHTPYGISKLVGELYVREFGGIANRCSCMYGPRQFGIVDQGWLSHIARNKIQGKQTVIYGDGKQVRDILHIDDVVRLLEAQMDALLGPRYQELAGRVFNVGGGFDNTLSLLELCRRWEIQPEFEPWRPADQKVFYCDTSRAQTEFGWQPNVSIEEGLAELFAWTKQSCQ